MPRPSIRYEVLIASPSGVVSERDVVAEVIESWNSAHARATGVTLQARRWELDAVPALGERPQGLLNRQLVDEADFVIALFFSSARQPDRGSRVGYRGKTHSIALDSSVGAYSVSIGVYRVLCGGVYAKRADWSPERSK
ncbi:MAG: hypothetical protein WBX22_21955 [Silvibacterium sp.]